MILGNWHLIFEAIGLQSGVGHEGKNYHLTHIPTKSKASQLLSLPSWLLALTRHDPIYLTSYLKKCQEPLCFGHLNNCIIEKAACFKDIVISKKVFSYCLAYFKDTVTFLKSLRYLIGRPQYLPICRFQGHSHF